MIYLEQTHVALSPMLIDAQNTDEKKYTVLKALRSSITVIARKDRV